MNVAVQTMMTFHFQGNYDYDAHAQVYAAARTPLGAKDTQA